MPALTISTDNNNPMRSRSPSPSRPPVSPITPTLSATRLPNAAAATVAGVAGGIAESSSSSTSSSRRRPPLTHSQPDQAAILPPPPQPLSFDANPDVLALKSAISILQMQRQRAIADMQSLSRVKDEAVRDPRAFMKDLVDGKINAGNKMQPDDDDDDDDDQDDDDQDQDQDQDDDDDEEEDDAGESSSTRHPPPPPPQETPSWTTIPQAQNVVRCPPINWSQYAVVGDSLDKLHSEQVARPSQGTPASLGPNGAYEFRAGDGRQEKYLGVAAPFAPTQDRLARKPRPKK